VTYRIVVDAEALGVRLDQLLSDRGLPFSRSQIKRRIEEGEVTVNGQAVRPARKLRLGDVVVFTPAPAEPVSLRPEEIPLRVLYEDAHLIVIDKPAGLVVHPAAGHASGTLVNALLHHCGDLAGVGGELRPGIVHRLDKDTSGVLVATKDDTTHARLAELFKNKDVERLYRAICAPPPPQALGTIRTLYGRHPTDRKRFSSKVDKGKRAVTHFRVVERFGDLAALVECRLETGRTHQIRVHLSEHGFPVLGDRVYGRLPRDAGLRERASLLGRQALHAATLAFAHPMTGARLEFSSPLPADMTQALFALRLLAGP
jgi:23S rRNA pseudouridine1911/1915/1917 synthase